MNFDRYFAWNWIVIFDYVSLWLMFYYKIIDGLGMVFGCSLKY
jgi:hypothetical protein